VHLAETILQPLSLVTRRRVVQAIAEFSFDTS
jgi:hypothetical protein